MVDKWAKEGVRPLVYMNPYFANLTGNDQIRTNYFKEGDEKGYFIKNDQNETYQLNSVSIKLAMIDFTNPAARDWAKNILKENLMKEGRASGWMCDFGEYTPMKVKYNHFNENSANYHNRYPYEWAKVNQEAVRELGLEDEIVYFMRAGSTMSPGYTSLFWMGDQLPTLDRYDGLHSALIGLINGGVSGFGIGHSDIGGYTALDDVPHLVYAKRDPEILQRWIEMNAFSDSIFRTHPSNKPDFSY